VMLNNQGIIEEKDKTLALVYEGTRGQHEHVKKFLEGI
jgi:hypothetical protein